MLKNIKYKVLNYSEIPEEITENHWLSGNTPDAYIIFSLKDDVEVDEVGEWILENYPEVEGQEIMIHLDY